MGKHTQDNPCPLVSGHGLELALVCTLYLRWSVTGHEHSLVISARIWVES